VASYAKCDKPNIISSCLSVRLSVCHRLSGVVVNGLALVPRGSHPGYATIVLGSNLGQVVYSHCLPSLLSSKKLAAQKGVFGLD